MATSVPTNSKPSLVAQFDEIVTATDILCAGVEGVFGEFVSHQMDLYRKVEVTRDENYRLKAENEAKDIKIKLSRNSYEQLMKKRTEAEMTVKQYEKQFTIIKELLSSNERMSMLNEAEKRSLAFLKDGRRRVSQSPGSLLGDSCETLSASDLSVEPTDIDEDVSILRDGTRWKRRRTVSIDAAESSLSKKQKAEDGKAVPSSDENDSLVVNGEVNMTSPLERQFKKPPPNKHRKRPSKAHLRATADTASSTQMYHLPVPNGQAQCDDDISPLPSAPPPEDVFDTEEAEVEKLERQLFSSPPPCSGGQVNTAPLNSILSPRIYPDLDNGGESTDGYCTPMSTPAIDARIPKTQSDINLTRRHVFISKTLMKPASCEVCNKKIGFGKNCLKCKDCRAVCHTECKDRVPLPCVHAVHTPKKKLKSSGLACFCPNSIPRVPALVVHCVKEIEQRGLTQVGIYRIPGPDRSIKELKERLLKAKGTPNLGKVDDINVVCGCLKDFLRNIREPILTYRMHPVFIQAIEEDSDEKALGATLEAIAQLPPCNKDTLAFLILHLQRVSSYSDANKMPAASLAKVFGPTIVGYGCENPQPSSMWRDTQLQPKVMERLMSISSEYWRQYLSPEDNPDPHSPSANLGSPATPEPRPVPESPFLGNILSPRSKVYSHTPVVTRSASSLSTTSTTSLTNTAKKTGGFFAALN